MPCVRHLSALMVGATLLSPVAAQTDSTSAQETWWKGLFRPDETATSPLPSDGTPNAQYDTKTLINNALDTAAFMNVPPERSLSDVTRLPATWTWTMPDTLRTLDSLDKADPKPLQGYRIQIYFGDLQEARAIRAAFRRDHPREACQLMPIAPNYAVTVGNYRDMWSAQRALRDGDVGDWRHALVIPSPIDLPALK